MVVEGVVNEPDWECVFRLLPMLAKSNPYIGNFHSLNYKPRLIMSMCIAKELKSCKRAVIKSIFYS